MTEVQFLEKIKKELENQLGNNYQIEIHKVIKNNNVILNCIIILKKNNNISPNIYLDFYYAQYKNGKTINEIVESIINMYKESVEDNLDVKINFDFTFENIKERIIVRLVNYKRNEKLLQSVPYIKFLDLAIIFHCLIKSQKEKISTVCITNKHLDSWKLPTNQLMKTAIKNTQTYFPPEICCIDDLIQQLWGQEREMELFYNNLIEGENQMFVLSNIDHINGATSLLYPDVIKKFSQEHHVNLFILPSSIHEVILLKDYGLLSKQRLIQVVKEVNETQVAQEDVLSDLVYYYDKEKEVFSY